MPYCPQCGAECRAGIQSCPDCGVGLIDVPPEELGAARGEGLELVELAGFPNFSEADMVRELLESNGIRTVPRGEADPIGATSGAAPTTLLVEEKDLDRAREIYDAYFAGEGVAEPGESGEPGDTA